MERQSTKSSLHEFGYNRFQLDHSVIGSYNMGIAYPVGYERLEAGEGLSNNIDFFARSTALQDPAFLDAEISVAHYFVPITVVDPFYHHRIQRFNNGSNRVPTPSLKIDSPFLTYVQAFERSGSTDSLTVAPSIGEGSLLEHLGLGVDLSGKITSTSESGTPEIDLGPILAYHNILDHYFTNTQLQDPSYTERWAVENIPAKGNTPTFTWQEITDGQDVSANCFFDPTRRTSNPPAYHNFLALRYVNFEPDYFTSARQAVGGPTASIAVTGNSIGARSIITGLLTQKVSDMLFKGGYSYSDFYRTIYGITNLSSLESETTFLGGNSGPLQMNAVTNTADDLGAQAGQVIASNPYNNQISFVAPVAGYYMPIIFIRPRTYYPNTSKTEMFITDIAEIHKPQYADLPASAILRSELACTADQLIKDRGGVSTVSVFGYTDRFNERRTRFNRVVGNMSSINSNYVQTRDIAAPVVSSDFITMDNLNYNPWLLTSKNTDHFQARVHQALTITQLLPVTSEPYIF